MGEIERMRKMIWVLPVLLGLVVATGCAKPPQEAIDAAKAAVESAKSAGAADYASDQLQRAQTALADLESELKVQEDKFFKSYTKANELAAAAKAAGEEAASAAATGKEAMKAEVVSMMDAAKTELAAVRDMLAKAPRGKGTQADLATLKADLDGVEAAFTEVQGMLDSGAVKDAMSRMEGLKSTLATVRSDIENAMAAKAGM